MKPARWLKEVVSGWGGALHAGAGGPAACIAGVPAIEVEQYTMWRIKNHNTVNQWLVSGWT